MNLQERIAIARRNSSPSDCYGAAFYIAEVIPKERELTPNEISEYLSGLKTIHRLEIECMVHLWNGTNGHIAVVTTLAPIRVVDRHGIGGPLRENLLLTDVMFEYGGLDILAQYLRR